MRPARNTKGGWSVTENQLSNGSHRVINNLPGSPVLNAKAPRRQDAKKRQRSGPVINQWKGSTLSRSLISVSLCIRGTEVDLRNGPGICRRASLLNGDLIAR